MSAAIDGTTTPKQVLMVVASPSPSTTPVRPVVCCASEHMYAWYEFTPVGYDVPPASPKAARSRSTS